MNAKTKTNEKYATTKQVGRFSLIGIFNTIIDFGLYNVFFNAVKLSVIFASLLSTTAAMTFSFVANRTFVFKSKDKKRLRQAIMFVLVSIVSAYVIQSGVIYFFKYTWTGPLNVGYNIVHAVIGNAFSKNFIINNGAKLAGVLVALVWNFLWYKRVVFKR